MTSTPTRARRAALLLGLLLATAAVSVTGLFAGLPASERVAGIVLEEIRLPRLAVALAAGAALGVAGLLVQRALRNPLAVPELLGVSGGAALTSALAVVTGVGGAATRPLIAFAGALGGGAVCLSAAARGRTPAQTLLLGAAISTGLQGAVLTVMATADQVQLAVIFTYLVGSLAGVTRDVAYPMLLPVGLALLATPLAVPALGVLALGDDAAHALGLRPGRWRVLILVLAAALVAVVVAACGPVSWVAFLAPTLVRWLWPVADERWRLIPTALLGSGLTATADVLARTAFAPFETPLGAWTALAGFALVAVMFARDSIARRRQAAA